MFLRFSVVWRALAYTPPYCSHWKAADVSGNVIQAVVAQVADIWNTSEPFLCQSCQYKLLHDSTTWLTKLLRTANQGAETKRKPEPKNEKNIFGRNENRTLFIISFRSETEKSFVSVFSVSGRFRHSRIPFNFHAARWEIAVDSLSSSWRILSFGRLAACFHTYSVCVNRHSSEIPA